MKNLLRAIFLSFYSQALYREVGRQWKGYGLLYILLVLALLLIPITLQRTSRLDDLLYGKSERADTATLKEIVQGITAQMPEMRIKNGALTVENANQPYTLTNPQTQAPIAVIDTTGSITSLADQTAPLLLTAKAVIVRSAHVGEEVISLTELITSFGFSPTQEIHITQKSLEQWQATIAIILTFAPYVMGFADLLAGFIAFGLRALLFAGFALLACIIFQKEMRFSALIRLAAIASTPVIFSEMLSIFFAAPLFSNKNLVYFLMHSAYLYHAVEANVSQKNR